MLINAVVALDFLTVRHFDGQGHKNSVIIYYYSSFYLSFFNDNIYNDKTYLIACVFIDSFSFLIINSQNKLILCIYLFIERKDEQRH